MTQPADDLTELEVALLHLLYPEVPEGLHKHKCESCHTVWEHANSCAGDDEAHTCPTCGELQFWRYNGSCKVTNPPILSPKDPA